MMEPVDAKPRRIASVGELLLEFLPSTRETRFESFGSMRKSPSGAAGIFACAVAALGGNAAFLGLVGRDAFSSFVLDAVLSYGVEVPLAASRREGQIGLRFVEHLPSEETGGDRRFMYYRHDSAGSRLCPDDIDPGFIDGCWAIHFPAMLLGLNSNMRDACMKVAELSSAGHCLLSIDPNIRPELHDSHTLDAIGRALALAQVATPSLEEARLLTGRQDADDALLSMLQMGPSLVAITMGAGGCLVGTHDGIEHIPGVPVGVVDTVGASDTFAAALLVGLEEGMGPYDGAAFANRVAALKVTRAGAIGAGLPTRAEVEAWAAPPG